VDADVSEADTQAIYEVDQVCGHHIHDGTIDYE